MVDPPQDTHSLSLPCMVIAARRLRAMSHVRA